MEIKGKRIVVTGGASGIGKAMAHRFVAERASCVIVADVNAEGARQVAAAIDGVSYPLDIRVPAEVEHFVAHVEENYGPIDLCCSNAGIAAGGGLETGIEIWQRVWDVNFLGHLNLARALMPRMVERGSGYWLQTASAAGLLSHVSSGPYAISKASAVAFAEWLAINYGNRGIGVSCLCPQGVETPMLDGDDPLMPFLREHALSPEAVAEAVVAGLAAERFLILPHPEVAEFFRRKGEDYDRWLRGMQRFRRSILDRMENSNENPTQ